MRYIANPGVGWRLMDDQPAIDQYADLTRPCGMLKDQHIPAGHHVIEDADG